VYCSHITPFYQLRDWGPLNVGGPWLQLSQHPLNPALLRLSEHGDVISETQTVFGYLSVILAPFGTAFGYFWLK